MDDLYVFTCGPESWLTTWNAQFSARTSFPTQSRDIPWQRTQLRSEAFEPKISAFLREPATRGTSACPSFVTLNMLMVSTRPLRKDVCVHRVSRSWWNVLLIAIKMSSSGRIRRCPQAPAPYQSMYLAETTVSCIHDDLVGGSATTSRDDFALGPPFSKHGEQEGQRVRDGDRKTQFCWS